MALDIQDGFCPVLLCDHCSEPIVEAGSGSALWLHRPKPNPRHRHHIYFVHNGCSAAFEQTAFTDAERSCITKSDLGPFLKHLIANSGGDALDAAIKAQLWERISSKLLKGDSRNPVTPPRLEEVCRKAL
jgi:hypothetical protein